jgi:hypothetical protein
MANTAFTLWVSASRPPTSEVVKTSRQALKVSDTKSNRKPIPIADTSTFACRPPRSPVIRISVIAVPSGNGSLPCISDTK